jgi:hypothetical protein
MSSLNKSTALERDQKALKGVDKYFANVTKVTLLGTDFTPAALKAVFQNDIDVRTALDAIRSQAKQQKLAMVASRAKVNDVRLALKGYILSTYGKDAVQMLEDLGIAAPKTGKPSVPTKAQALVKAAATRKARGTVGRKRRLSIKGTPAATNTPQK